MLTDWRAERGKFIFAQGEESELPLAQLKDVVIDPKNGKICAWWARTLDGLKLFFPEDIISWNKEMIVIQGEHDFREPEHLPKLQKVLDREVRVLGADVMCEKKKIGQVLNFSFHTLGPQILSIFVRKPYQFWKNPRIITAAHIEKITEAGVFISSLWQKIKEVATENSAGIKQSVEPE